jgi:hypothetical protein
MEDMLIAIMATLQAEDGQSDHRLAKQLGLGLSQLNRALALLGTSPSEGGLGWVTTDSGRKPRRAWLTPLGRQMIAAS